MKLNYGCGESKLEDFINVDIEKSCNPDLICDIRKESLPFKDGEIEEIWCIHNIEHIEFKYWGKVFFEFHRVLQKDGTLVLAYPEFEKCAKYFIENHLGVRDFWRMTLYGRQKYPGDYHTTPVISSHLKTYLLDNGFKDIYYTPEKGSCGEYGTILSCKRGNIVTRGMIANASYFGISA
jgi:predicted SAM-dependent methyltransferase